METKTLTFLVLGLFVGWLLFHLIKPFRSPLRAVPGPFLARFTDAWYVWETRKGSFQESNVELHKQYGTLVRYGPERYSISDPEAIKTVYGIGSKFPKSSWYSSWSSPGQWSLFSDQSIRRHAQNRKQYQATYSLSSLVNYEPFVDECADLFTQRLHEIATNSDRPIDLRHWFQCYAFDVIGLITYRKRLGFLDRGEDVGGVIGALEDHLAYATLVGIYPGLHRWLFNLKNYWAGAKGAGRAYVLSFTRERIREGQTSPKAVVSDAEEKGEHAVQDFLSKFLAKHAADPQNFTSDHVLAGCVSNMVAGSDTTAISLSACLYYLLKHPRCLQKLRGEIDSLTAEGALSKNPTFNETQQMPYLQAVIKEALRMHPATGLPLERVVPEGGATISGHYFPEDTIVGVNTWVAHRDMRIFGNDADIFKPERWMVEEDAQNEENAQRLAAMNRHYMPFGLGSRTCIGRHVSMLEMCKLIPRIVRDFDFALDTSLTLHDWRTESFWFVKPMDFQARIQVRRREGDLKMG